MKQIEELIKEKGGLAKTSDFLEEGFSHYQIREMEKEGKIDKIRHGYYLDGSLGIEDEVLISLLFPDAVVSMESALFHYGYSDFLPRMYSLSVRRGFSRSRLKSSPIAIKPYFVDDEIFLLGHSLDSFNGVSLSVYDRERTICDLYKRRNKVDPELLSIALKRYTMDEKKNLDNLSLYAKKMRVYGKMKEILEVLMGGEVLSKS